jgi:hypothetical protein
LVAEVHDRCVREVNAETSSGNAHP